MKFYTLLFSFIIISLIVKAQPPCIPAADFTFSDTCSNMPTSFAAIGGTGTSVTYTWDFGDPASGAANTATGQYATHKFTPPPTVGDPPLTYNVRLAIAGPGPCVDTVYKSVNIYQTDVTIGDLQDALICKSITLNATGSGSSFLWSDGQTGPSVTFTEAGRYWVRTSSSHCSAADTFKISVWGQGNHGDYNWNFGNGGLNFSTNPPQVISSGGTGFPAGSSSISSPSGKLLFYTNGQAIYDKGNNSIGTIGNAATDNVLIVPDPRANNIYYVFTTNTTDGLTYSVVDMSANGGAGQVTQTNVMLDPSANVGMLAGLSDSAGAFWVSAYDVVTSSLLTYKISNAGIVTTPVPSPAGFSTTLPDEGTLKFSNDGKKASVAIPGKNIVEVYDFNRATGVFSNPVQISVTTPSGVEFSSDDSKLYVGTDGDHHLYEYDLTSIATPPVVIANDPGTSYDDLATSPDGRIFVALGNSGVGIINNPDLVGAATLYQTANVVTANFNLPNIIADYFTSKSWGLIYQDTCTNSPTLVQFSAPDTVRNWTWSFDGVADPQVNYPGSPTSQHTFTTAGSHTVSIHVFHHCGDTVMTRTITIVDPPVINLPASYLVCIAGDSAKLDATNPKSTYVWSPNGETKPVIYAKTTGAYSVLVTNNAGCTATGSSNVTFNNQPKPNLGNDTTLCFGQSTTLNPGSYPGATFITWTGAVSSSAATVLASVTGTYMVDINFSGCVIKDTINVKVLPQLFANLGADDTLCAVTGASKVIGNISNTDPTISYAWFGLNPAVTLANTPTITVTSSNDYRLKVYSGTCSASDTVHVDFVNQLTVNLGVAKTYCVNSFHQIDAGNSGVPGVSYLWSPNGETTQKISVASGIQGPVTYSVVVTVGKGGASGGCSANGSVTYTYVIPPVIHLGSDRHYCEGQSTVLDADPLNNHPGFTYLWNPGNQTTSKITANTTDLYKVIASDGNCASAVAQVNLYFDPKPAVTLPAEFVFCKTKDSSVVVALSGTDPLYAYLWSTSDQTDAITVAQEGIYSVNVKFGNCHTALSTNVVSICEAHLYVPTAFSPNGDGNNEVFQIYGDGIVQYDFRIFDRWGELIFVSTDLSQSWDGRYKGKIVEEGVYIWKVTYYGKAEKGLSKFSMDGDVTVIK